MECTRSKNRGWKHLRRESEPVARCTVERLMPQLGLHGVIRSRKSKRATCPDTAAVRPADLVTRRFVATRLNQTVGIYLDSSLALALHHVGEGSASSELAGCGDDEPLSGLLSRPGPHQRTQLGQFLP